VFPVRYELNFYILFRRTLYGKGLRTPVEQHLPQQEIQGTGLSERAPSSTNNDTLKIATAAQQNFTEPSEAVSEKYKIMVITKMVLNLVKQNGCWIS
jgi:hypothetical protein